MKERIGALAIIVLFMLILAGCDLDSANTGPFMVTFDTQGGEEIDPVEIDLVRSFSLPTATREGHTFLGWVVQGDQSGRVRKNAVKVSSDTVLVAQWRINQYTVSFDTHGGSSVSPITQDFETVVTAPSDPVKEGHTFDGWYTDTSLTSKYTFSTMGSSSITLHAKWTVNQYTVTFYDEDEVTILGTSTVTHGASATPPVDPTKTATKQYTYTFDGWNQSFIEVIEDMSIYATYQSSLNQYTITFKDFDGTILQEETLDYGAIITAPAEPVREGYAFEGWDLPFDIITEHITIIAQYTVNAYNLIYYEEDGTTILQTTAYEFGADLSDHQAPDAPEKEGYTFDGWTQLPSNMPAHDVIRTASYTSDDVDDYVPMVQVGVLGTTYTIPTGANDSGTATVDGGYLMATTQTTYELWYEVRIWAEANGYHFQNLGREGNDGTIGLAPTDRKLEPVTTISWRDVIVWTNALSEMTGLDPVYRTAGGAIIRDSRDANGSVVDAAVQTNNNGYRLPTSMEWEMAARWRNSSGDGSILVGGRYWTPGSYASGATADYNNATATQLVAWYNGNSGSKTQPVGQKTANHLGIYDMSGNVWEWTYTTIGSGRFMRGGSYNFSAVSLRVVVSGNDIPLNAYSNYGFRLVRDAVSITQHTVIFEDYDGSPIDVQFVNHGNSATPPSDPVREGYTFEGWSLPFDIITENITIIAQYTVNAYNLIYYEEDGTTILQTTAYEFGADLSMHEAPEAPEKEGYTFNGWEQLPSNMPSHDVIRIASYTVNQYNITFGTVSDDFDPLSHILLYPDETIVQISLGHAYSSVLTSMGRLFMWGSNWAGQLGDGTTTNSNIPIEITSQFPLANDDKIIQISLGNSHSSILTSSGRLFMWGNNESGQLGNATYTTKTTPIEITSRFSLLANDKIIQVALGYNHSSALSSTGRLFMWGGNETGQLGNSSQHGRTTPTEITNNFSLDSNDKIIQVSLGMYHSSALTVYGRLYLWGYNYYGQVGVGSDAIYYTRPVEITSNFSLTLEDKIIQVSLGKSHSSALTLNGRLYLWGHNYVGQLGDNSYTNRNVPTEITNQFTLTLEDKIIQVSIGEAHSSALTSNGRLYLWGMGGMIGDSTTLRKVIPTEITSQFILESEEKITQISLGSSHSAALISNSHLFMWGSNWAGQLGDGTLTNSKTPAKSIFRFYQTIVVKTFDFNEPINYAISEKIGYTILDWFSDKELLDPFNLVNMSSQNSILYSKWSIIDYSINYVLDGSTNHVQNPSSYQVNDQYELLNPNKAGHTFGGWFDNSSFEGKVISAIPLNTVGDLTLYAKWIINQHTVMYGNMPDDFDSLNHIPLQPGETIIQISLGGYHSAVLTSTGRLFMWGQNNNGQLGDGSYTNKIIPIEITSRLSLNYGETITNISMGAYHSAALTSSGRLFMWGQNNNGQVGDGSYNHKNIPTEITSRFYSINLNEDRICHIDLGGFHSAALTSSGRLFMWGINAWGVIGDGSIVTDRNTPIEITNRFSLDSSDKIIQVTLDINNSSVLTFTGRLFIWGNNSYGQIGNNSYTSTRNPVEITNYFSLEADDKIVRVSLGELHSSALTSSGRLFMWGNNANGELGDGTTINKNIPTEITNNFALSSEDQIILVSLGYSHSSALTSTGRFFLWGRNEVGQLGDSTNTTKTIPNEITNQFNFGANETIIMVSLGGYHSAIMTSSIHLYLWGYNYYGEIGDATNTNRYTPVMSKFRVYEVIAIETYNYHDTFTQLIPEKSGYTFAGWFTDRDLLHPYDSGSLIVQNIVLYAKWIISD